MLRLAPKPLALPDTFVVRFVSSSNPTQQSVAVIGIVGENPSSSNNTLSLTVRISSCPLAAAFIARVAQLNLGVIFALDLLLVKLKCAPDAHNPICVRSDSMAPRCFGLSRENYCSPHCRRCRFCTAPPEEGGRRQRGQDQGSGTSADDLPPDRFREGRHMVPAADGQDAGPQPTRGIENGSGKPSRDHHRRAWCRQDDVGQLHLDGSVASFKCRQVCRRASVVRSQAAKSKRLSMN